MSARTMRSRRRKIERRARREELIARKLKQFDWMWDAMREAAKPFLRKPPYDQGDFIWDIVSVTDKQGRPILTP